MVEQSGAPAASVPVAHLTLPDHWRSVEFASDVHLSVAMPRTAAAFFDYLESSTADAILLLGDMFEVWVGDDTLDHPGFEADCCARLRSMAVRRTVGFMAGNRDFLVGDRLLQGCGLTALADPTLLHAWDQAVLVTHGDALCLDDTAYQTFRREVRTPAWQQAFLARPFDERSALARHMRDASESRKAQPGTPYVDIDATEAARWLSSTGAGSLIHGHTHQPGSTPLPEGLMRHVLSDWDADSSQARGDVLRWTRHGIERVTMVQAPPAH